MIDANANRAREAMRVLEDVARFLLDDAALSRDFKTLRHDLRGVLDRLPPGVIEVNRDTPGDVGTAMTTAGEAERSGPAGIAIAAGKRLTEALRVLEEAAKSLPEACDAAVPAAIESLRYRAYDLEHRLHVRLGSARARQWRLCVLLTRDLCRKPWRDVLDAVITGGADCIQVREKHMHSRDLLEHIREVIKTARPARASVIVNDRLDLAMAAGADGVHLGNRDLPIVEARRIAGRSMLIGASTHNLTEAGAAVEAGADYCGVGMMFPSALKPDRVPDGIGYLREFLQRYPQVPHLAIGGITPETAPQAVAAGAKGLAASSAVCAADDPEAAARAIQRCLDISRPAQTEYV